MIKWLLLATLLVGAVATALVTVLLVHQWPAAGEDLKPDDLRFFLDAYKAIGIGFLVALLGVVIPHLRPEARDRFERFRDSRVAYSHAKTSVIYLPESLTSLSFAEAAAAVQEAHEALHLAETYPKELKKHLHWHPNPDTWVDRNYWDLFAMRHVLDANVDGWSARTGGQRLQALREALKVVDDVFGADNERWSRLPSAERERQIEENLKTCVTGCESQSSERQGRSKGGLSHLVADEPRA